MGLTTTHRQARPKWHLYVIYILCALLTIAIGYSGIDKLMGAANWIEQFNNFGYPIWFMYIIGALQVVGAIGLWMSKTRVLSAGLFILLMMGAAFSNIMVGAYLFLIPNLVLILLSTIVIWMSR